MLALWRMKVMWLGLAPVYMLACAKALFGGPTRKPLYKVTRKANHFRWYWRETLPQALLAAILPGALLAGLLGDRLAAPTTVICAGYWGVTYSAALATFVMRGWFGRPTGQAAADDRAASRDVDARRGASITCGGDGARPRTATSPAPPSGGIARRRPHVAAHQTGRSRFEKRRRARWPTPKTPIEY